MYTCIYYYCTNNRLFEHVSLTQSQSISQAGVTGSKVTPSKLITTITPQAPSSQDLILSPSFAQLASKSVDELNQRAKSKAVLQAKSLVQQSDEDAMEVDVVGTHEPLIYRIELPPHLRDHTYSLYNPVDGVKATKSRVGISKSASIPSVRVSYAPPVSVHKLPN